MSQRIDFIGSGFFSMPGSIGRKPGEMQTVSGRHDRLCVEGGVR
jgi:hypothetical protein